MIVLICYKEIDKESIYYNKYIVSHGINFYTNDNVVLPQVTPQELDGKFNYDLNSYVIYDNEEES